VVRKANDDPGVAGHRRKVAESEQKGSKYPEDHLAGLDWIERTIAQPKLVAAFWGELAAKSGLTWPRAQRWLTSGRPLSLVALDALIARLRDTRSEFNDVRLTEVAIAPTWSTPCAPTRPGTTCRGCPAR
jgi:hypothetical protein